MDHDGEMLGVMSYSQAMIKAAEHGLDLVEIVPNAEPPVCKILDFGKHLYDLKKKTQNAKKKTKVIDIKEIHVRPNIGAHDLNFKLRSLEKFIQRGEKVKIMLRFKGREMSHSEIGEQLVKDILEKVSAFAVPEMEPKLENYQITTVLVAKK